MNPAALAHEPTQAATNLALAHSNLYAALGVVCLVAWYVIHRMAAHRHHFAEVAAKILLVSGGVILAVDVGAIANWVLSANDATCRWLTAKTKDPTFTTYHLGALSLLAFIDVCWVAATTYDLIKHKRRPGGASRGAGGGWILADHHFDRYGWISLGPLSAALPGWIGAVVATALTMLSATVGHLVGLLFGLG